MDLFEYAGELDYGEIHLKRDAETGLQAIVAIHNLKLGPAIGGCRFIEYGSSDEALQDALRLARGMTYKAAISGLPHGGGKAVIMRPANLTDQGRERLFAVYGQFVDSLGGNYITCEDSGTSVDDMNIVHDQTEHVLGFDPDKGSSGDPSPFTAYGVRRGIEAAVKFRWDREDLEGLTVAVQGVGSVGHHLARELGQLGASLVVTDIDEDAVTRVVDELGARAVGVDEIYGVECDIFAPCALGGAINDQTLPQLTCEIVAGAANNQLLEARHGVALMEREILYAPDYAINAGGLINVAQEFVGYDPDAARAKTSEIYDTMWEIYERAQRESVPTHMVADRIVEEIVFGRILH